MYGNVVTTIFGYIVRYYQYTGIEHACDSEIPVLEVMSAVQNSSDSRW